MCSLPSLFHVWQDRHRARTTGLAANSPGLPWECCRAPHMVFDNSTGEGFVASGRGDLALGKLRVKIPGFQMD